MFTGIVEELGTVETVEPTAGDTVRFRIAATTVLTDASLGASIAHNGCCLTVVAMGDGWYDVEAVAETLQRTNLGDLAAGSIVNLERPVRLEDRLGGHLVQGHVDGVGIIVEPAPDLKISIDPALTRYVVEKGSITVDGCSLTVVTVGPDWFRIAVIPHTAGVTTLGRKGAGDRVNLEVDVMAKHIERLLTPYLPTTTIPTNPPAEGA